MSDKKPWWRKDKDRPDLEDALGGWFVASLALGMFVVVMTVDDAQFFMVGNMWDYVWLLLLFLSLLKFGMLIERRYGQSEKNEG